jgi:hypothetical protein
MLRNEDAVKEAINCYAYVENSSLLEIIEQSNRLLLYKLPTTYMEPFKPRTKILLIVGASKVFSGNKRDAQISTLANGIEVQSKQTIKHSDSKPTVTDPLVSFDEIRKEIQANTSIKVR